MERFKISYETSIFLSDVSDATIKRWHAEQDTHIRELVASGADRRLIRQAVEIEGRYYSEKHRRERRRRPQYPYFVYSQDEFDEWEGRMLYDLD